MADVVCGSHSSHAGLAPNYMTGVPRPSFACRSIAAESGEDTADVKPGVAADVVATRKKIEEYEAELKDLPRGDPERAALRQELAALRQKEVELLKRTPGTLDNLAPKLPTLLQQGWELVAHPDITSAWKIRKPGGKEVVYADPANATAVILRWITDAVATQRFRTYEQEMPHSTVYPAPAPPLGISGLVKTGKTFTAEYAVPAVLAAYARKHPGVLDDMVIFNLDASTFSSDYGLARMLRDMLLRLLKLIKLHRVELVPGALKEATEAADASCSDDELVLGNGVINLLHSIRTPVLVVLDEYQSLFALRRNGQPDVAGILWMQNVWQKRVMLYGAHNVLWVITGSSMVLAWHAIASAPTNGYALLTRFTRIDLPAWYPRQHMQMVLDHVNQNLPVSEKLDNKLLDSAERSPAVLCYMAADYIAEGRPADLQDFSRRWRMTKLVAEGRKEWIAALERFNDRQRIAIHAMAFPTVGYEFDQQTMDFTTWQALQPFVVQTKGGRSYLKAPLQRRILTLILERDGSLVTGWKPDSSTGSLVDQEAARLLVLLGETADFVYRRPADLKEVEQQMGPKAYRQANNDFRSYIKGMATRLEIGIGKSYQQWDKEPWFQRALRSQYNSKDMQRYLAGQVTIKCAEDLLVFYVRLVRNILSHTKAWPEIFTADPRDPLNFDEADLDVIPVLPKHLNLDIEEFISETIAGIEVWGPYGKWQLRVK